MLVETIPEPTGSGRGPTVEDKLRFAQRYVEVGWHIFVVRPSKSPYRNCPECDTESEKTYVQHAIGSCGHLLCHGFHAGTRDMNRIVEMFQQHPGGILALRTGWPSGVFALDFESHSSDPEESTGLQVYDEWESWTGGVELTPTLRSRSESGGLHVLYQLPENVRLNSYSRILPNTDIKADKGYVGLPPTGSRVWIDNGLPSVAPENLIEWLLEQRSGEFSRRGGSGGTAGHVDGYDFQKFWREGCPGGVRDEFFNDLIFRLRKKGTDRAEAERITYAAWQKAAQPPHAKWPMPWRNVEYKLRRIWMQVEVDEVPPAFAGWVNSLSDPNRGWAQDTEGNTVKKVGRVTVVRRQR